jgi:hypothetical protein
VGASVAARHRTDHRAADDGESGQQISGDDQYQHRVHQHATHLGADGHEVVQDSLTTRDERATSLCGDARQVYLDPSRQQRGVQVPESVLGLRSVGRQLSGQCRRLRCQWYR